MNLFPFYEDIENKKILVVGGGRIAADKIKKLRNFTDKITVVSPDFKGCADLRNSKENSGIIWIQRRFVEKDLDNADVVIGAADDHELQVRISGLCREKNIPVNIVDKAELCTFMFPALISRGDLTIAISTNGKSPAAAAYVRRVIEAALPDAIGDIISRMGQIRHDVMMRVPDQSVRSALLHDILQLLLDTDNMADRQIIKEKIDLCAGKTEHAEDSK